MDWTCVLSGSPATRNTALTLLKREGADLSDDPSTNPSWGLATAGEGWITCRAPDVDKIVQAGDRASWSLRAHWPTPVCRVCYGDGPHCLHCNGAGYSNKRPPTAQEQLAAEVADLKRRLAALGG